MSPSSTPTTEAPGVAPGGSIRVRIRRFDPSVDAAPRFESYEVPRTRLMRVLDVLDHVHEALGVDLGYRWLCTSKKCGTCAVNVNGSPVLACWEEAQDGMTIEPIGNMPVVRDLVTSRDGYEATLAAVAPQLQRREEYPGFPEPLAADDFAPSVHLRDCIQCLACQSVCPVIAQKDAGFAGPAVLVALAELALDPRDGAARGATAGSVAKVFSCVSCYECERVCPAEIPIVSEAIEPLKRLATAQGHVAGARRAAAFLAVVKERGFADGARVAFQLNGLTLRALRLGLRLFRRGKADILGAWRARRAPGADSVRRTYEHGEGSP
ncbi:MAG: 4Fe-4S dicluster domain-containing protein [Alphaproteobacteria bacterium]|nr:4Fe-4S dicluster domain-containing protein [Alphaproteobacteria bacterium]